MKRNKLHYAPDELEAMVDHIAYELRMMCYFADPLTVVGQPWMLESALIDTCMIHARSLDDFLSNKATASGMVTAEHYFDTRPWPGKRDVFTKDEGGRLSTRMAHLSIMRLDPLDWKLDGERSGWAVRVMEHFDRFLADLAGAHPERHSWFAGPFAEAKGYLAASLDGKLSFAQLYPSR